MPCAERIVLSPTCGACRDTIQPELEDAVSLTPMDDDEDGVRIQFQEKSFQWDPLLRCWNTSCRDCNTAPENACFHKRCVEQFRYTNHDCSVLSNLVRNVLWRKPWPHAPSGVLKDATRPSRAAVRAAAKHIDIGFLGRFPLEISEMIRRLSADAPFWNLVKAVEQYQTVTSPQKTTTTVTPLSLISSWSRSAGVVLSISDAQLPPFVRIKTDALGIVSIERFNEYPKAFSQRTTKFYSYIMLDETTSDGVSVAMRDGMARLLLEDSHRGLHIWDTPTPPRPMPVVRGFNDYGRAANEGTKPQISFPGFNFSAEALPFMCRFTTVNLEDATGLTFFYTQDGLHSIFAHTAEALAAEHPLGLPGETRQSPVYSIYMPIPPGDEIEWLSIRAASLEMFSNRLSPPSFMFWMKLSGVVTIGPEDQAYAPPTMFVKSPKRILYNVDGNFPISLVGACSVSTPEEYRLELPPGFPTIPSGRCPAPRLTYRSLKCYSTAPLEGVVKTRVYLEDSGLATGVWLKYANGGERTVGECRVGIDRYVECKTPTLVIHTVAERMDDFLRPGIGMRFEDEREPEDEDEVLGDDGEVIAHVDDEGDGSVRMPPLNRMWLPHPMLGALEYWISRDECAVGQTTHRRVPTQMAFTDEQGNRFFGS